MKTLAILKEAFRASGVTTVALFVIVVTGCWSLIATEWALGIFQLSFSAIMFVSIWDQLRPRAGRSAVWTTGLTLAAGVGFLGAACASAATEDTRFTIACGFCATVALITPWMARRRQADGRSKISA